MMARYLVVFEMSASVGCEVQAGSEAEARQAASDKVGTPVLCHECSGTVVLHDVGEIVDVIPLDKA
jgi:hypothetical protein